MDGVQQGVLPPSLALLEAVPVARLDDGVRVALGEFLRRLGHDINGSLGALRLELESLRVCATELADAAAAGDGPARAAALEAFEDIVANLASVQESAEVLTDGLRRAGVDWAQAPRGGPPRGPEQERQE